MLGTIRNWFFRRILNRHRLLFRYWNGSRFVWEDPFVLFRGILNTQLFDPESDLKAMTTIGDPKVVVRKISHIAEGVRDIFCIPEFRSDRAGGLSEMECVQLLMTFMAWMEDVKKNGVTSQILPTSTPAASADPGDSLAPAANGSAEANDMNETSDSSSTSPELSAVMPGMSLLESLPL